MTTHISQRGSIRSIVALGDSFSEGYGDFLRDGTPRGWADLVAIGLATHEAHELRYANLAVRGRKLDDIGGKQLERAIALLPDMVLLNAGGNDVIRPRMSVEGVSASIRQIWRRLLDAGIRPVFVSSPNPSFIMPAGRIVRARGDRVMRCCRAWALRDGVEVIDLWADRVLADYAFWAFDRIHLNTRGHVLAATRVLRHLGADAPAAWEADAVPSATARAPRLTLDYVHSQMLPWVGRRLLGRSSGDGLTAKRPELTIVEPLTGALPVVSEKFARAQPA